MRKNRIILHSFLPSGRGRKRFRDEIFTQIMGVRIPPIGLFVKTGRSSNRAALRGL
jgi:hypothetical protein